MLEKVDNGYQCCACGFTKDRRHKIMRHIRSTHGIVIIMVIHGN